MRGEDLRDNAGGPDLAVYRHPTSGLEQHGGGHTL